MYCSREVASPNHNSRVPVPTAAAAARKRLQSRRRSWWEPANWHVHFRPATAPKTKLNLHNANRVHTDNSSTSRHAALRCRPTWPQSADLTPPPHRDHKSSQYDPILYWCSTPSSSGARRLVVVPFTSLSTKITLVNYYQFRWSSRSDEMSTDTGFQNSI